jgi:hypothetical protein
MLNGFIVHNFGYWLGTSITMDKCTINFEGHFPKKKRKKKGEKKKRRKKKEMT